MMKKRQSLVYLVSKSSVYSPTTINKYNIKKRKTHLNQHMILSICQS